MPLASTPPRLWDRSRCSTCEGSNTAGRAISCACNEGMPAVGRRGTAAGVGPARRSVQGIQLVGGRPRLRCRRVRAISCAREPRSKAARRALHCMLMRLLQGCPTWCRLLTTKANVCCQHGRHVWSCGSARRRGAHGAWVGFWSASTAHLQGSWFGNPLVPKQQLPTHLHGGQPFLQHCPCRCRASADGVPAHALIEQRRSGGQ